MVIEIDISRSRVDRPSIYAALGVKEVWRFNGQSLTIELLGSDGTYRPSDTSHFLPIRAEEVVPWLLEQVTDVTTWERRLRTWIRNEILPRKAT